MRRSARRTAETGRVVARTGHPLNVRRKVVEFGEIGGGDRAARQGAGLLDRQSAGRQAVHLPGAGADIASWITYATSISKTLYLKGVLMPVVATKDLRVVNGIGRLQMQAESKRSEVAVVLVTEDEARLADVAAGKAFLLQGGDCAETFADCATRADFREGVSAFVEKRPAKWMPPQ